MAVDFSALDREVDQEQLRKDVEEAKNNSGDIPKGTYIVGIDKMEIRVRRMAGLCSSFSAVSKKGNTRISVYL